MKVRIELAKEKPQAESAAKLLHGLGYKVDGPSACEIVWISNASDRAAFPLVTYSDPSDQEVFIVVGRK